MKITLVIGLLAFSTVAAADEHFSAANVPSAHIRGVGRIVISNSDRGITADRFVGEIRHSLLTLRTSRTLAYSPFGAAVFNSNAPVSGTVPQYVASVIAEAAHTHGVDPRLVAAVAARESAGNPNARSRVGACGIMQLMPATARFLGITDIFDVRQNVFAGTRYLRTLLDTFHGDLDLTLAAYNAGPGAVQRYNGVPPYAETRAYVKHIRQAYEASLAR
jgi:soluble lytic murein transglycosylase-like protein